MIDALAFESRCLCEPQGEPAFDTPADTIPAIAPK